MLKKAAAAKSENSLKVHFDKLNERLVSDVKQIESLITSSQIPMLAFVPDEGNLENLMKECDDGEFWKNFKLTAPILFCMAIEKD